MIYTESIFEKKDVELYRIYELEKTNLVSAFYTSNHISAWKYGNSPWKSSYELLSKQLGVTMTDMCTTYQTHTDNIRVMKKENGDTPCIDLYLNTPEQVQISLETFDGLYYTLSRLDMLNYANTSLTFMMLRNEPINRVDYTSNNNNQISISDSSTTSGSVGRSFNGSMNKDSLLN